MLVTKITNWHIPCLLIGKKVNSTSRRKGGLINACECLITTCAAADVKIIRGAIMQKRFIKRIVTEEEYIVEEKIWIIKMSRSKPMKTWPL